VSRWLVGIVLLAASVYALGLLTETPDAAPECTWGASSVYIDADGTQHGPVTTGCVPR
jgi:hypothetical protein